MSLNPEQSQELKKKLTNGISIGASQGISHALLRELGVISPDFQKDFKQLQDTNKKLIMDLATAISESNANVPSLARRQKTDYGTKKLVQQVYAKDTLKLDDTAIDTILGKNTETKITKAGNIPKKSGGEKLNPSDGGIDKYSPGEMRVLLEKYGKGRGRPPLDFTQNTSTRGIEKTDNVLPAPAKVQTTTVGNASPSVITYDAYEKLKTMNLELFSKIADTITQEVRSKYNLYPVSQIDVNLVNTYPGVEWSHGLKYWINPDTGFILALHDNGKLNYGLARGSEYVEESMRKNPTSLNSIFPGLSKFLDSRYRGGDITSDEKRIMDNLQKIVDSDYTQKIKDLTTYKVESPTKQAHITGVTGAPVVNDAQSVQINRGVPIVKRSPELKDSNGTNEKVVNTVRKSSGASTGPLKSLVDEVKKIEAQQAVLTPAQVGLSNISKGTSQISQATSPGPSTPLRPMGEVQLDGAGNRILTDAERRRNELFASELSIMRFDTALPKIKNYLTSLFGDRFRESQNASFESGIARAKNRGTRISDVAGKEIDVSEKVSEWVDRENHFAIILTQDGKVFCEFLQGTEYAQRKHPDALIPEMTKAAWNRGIIRGDSFQRDEQRIFDEVTLIVRGIYSK